MKQHILLTALLLISGSAVMNAASFANGSFELNGGGACDSGGNFTTLPGGSNCVTGWTISPNSIDYINSYWQHADGTHSIDLNGNNNATSISQTFDTTPGGFYQVSFALAGNPDQGPTIKNLNVSVAGFSGNYSFDTTATTGSDMGWLTKTFNFVGNGTSATLTFTSTTVGCCYGPALDDVSVDAAAVPEPGSMVMVSMAAALLALGRRRLRRKS